MYFLKKNYFCDGKPVIHSVKCGSSPTKMKHEGQVKYDDILVGFFF